MAVTKQTIIDVNLFPVLTCAGNIGDMNGPPGLRCEIDATLTRQRAKRHCLGIFIGIWAAVPRPRLST